MQELSPSRFAGAEFFSLPKKFFQTERQICRRGADCSRDENVCFRNLSKMPKKQALRGAKLDGAFESSVV